MGEIDRDGAARRAYDVIVLGGGPAGAAAGLALARKGLAVALLAKPDRGPAIGETVPPAIKRPLAQLGVWESFRAAAHRAAPGTVAIWGAAQPQENDFLFNPYGPGWHLDRIRFDAMLRAAARDAGVDLRCGVARDCTFAPGIGWKVLVDGARHRTLAAQWMIDATGRNAWLARRMGARRHRADRLVALVRFALAGRTNEPRTLIEACADGWWYGASLPHSRVVVALFTDADLLPRGAAARAHLWDRMLARTELIAGIFRDCGTASAIHTTAAWSGRAHPCAGQNWLAIGDAAQCHDPLSGQGIARALRAALQAADYISAHGRHGATLDDPVSANEREYETYLGARRLHYGREQRWPQRPFWQRRGLRWGSEPEVRSAMPVSPIANFRVQEEH
jgi:flavin-dependent dehydrogenase